MKCLNVQQQQRMKVDRSSSSDDELMGGTIAVDHGGAQRGAVVCVLGKTKKITEDDESKSLKYNIDNYD